MKMNFLEQVGSSGNAFDFYSGGAGSNPAQDTSSPYWDSSYFPSTSPGKYRDSTSTKAVP
jgi:hypothetical protein